MAASKAEAAAIVLSGHILSANFGLMVEYPSMPWRMRCLADNNTPYYAVRLEHGELLLNFCILWFELHFESSDCSKGLASAA